MGEHRHSCESPLLISVSRTGQANHAHFSSLLLKGAEMKGPSVGL